MAEMTLSDHEVDETVALFSALAHPGRLRILLALASEAPRAAGELGVLAGLKQTAASHQLRLLKNARLITAQRAGRQVLYSLADAHVAHIIRDAVAHMREP